MSLIWRSEKFSFFTIHSTRVLIFGTFDHLHLGHDFVVREAMKRGDVTVIVARDHNVQRIKGKSAAQSETERADALRRRFPKVHVLLGDSMDFLGPVRAMKPDLILLGYDQNLPPGVTRSDLLCPVETLPSFQPETYKSSRLGQ